MPSRSTIAGVPLPLHGNGATEDEEDTGDEKKDDRKSRAAQALTYIRGKLSEDGLAQIGAMIHDPSLALTTIQSDIVAKIGRYGSHGDKAGVRRAVMELVEKVDVSSPKDSAVLIAREGTGDVLSSSVSEQLGRLEGGKQSLQMTQGGRAVGRIQSILGQHKAFGWADGMDRGWRRLTERFGQQANGAIDVVVGAKGTEMAGAANVAGSPAPPQAPVGSWNVGSAGAGVPNDAPVGSWVMPQAAGTAAPEGGQPAIGQWTTGSPAGSAAPGAPGGAGDGPQIGKWSVPGQQAPGAPGQAAAPIIGQWTTQAGATGGPGAEQGAPAVGKWQAPGGGAAGTNPAATPEVGKWNVPGVGTGAPDAAAAAHAAAKGAPGASAPVGQWITPDPGAATPEAKVGQWRAPTSSEPVVGKFMSGADIPIEGDLNLSEILKQNPNVSKVRLVELVQSADAKQPPKLRALTEIARSIFGKKFGF